MGTGYMLHCPQCNYQTLFFLGIGFAYPLVYAETQEKGNRGELGEDIKEFFSEHPDGVIDSVPAIFQCEKCNQYDTAPSLRMYIPDETKLPRKKIDGSWSIAMPFHGEDYVAPGGFEDNFIFYKEHMHSCKRCGGKMKFIANENDIEKLKCPNCKDQFLDVEEYMNWD